MILERKFEGIQSGSIKNQKTRTKKNQKLNSKTKSRNPETITKSAVRGEKREVEEAVYSILVDTHLI